MEAGEKSVSLEKVLNVLQACPQYTPPPPPIPFLTLEIRVLCSNLQLHERSFLGATQPHPLEFKVYSKMVPHL